MKYCAKLTPEYPQYLEYLRVLCRVWRNLTWREHVVALRPHDHRVDGLRKPFTAGFAKWRYQTLAVCMEQLRPLREMHEDVFRSRVGHAPGDRLTA